MARQKTSKMPQISQKPIKMPIFTIFFLAAVSLTVLIFLTNRSSIIEVVERTDLIEVLLRSFKNRIEPHKNDAHNSETRLTSPISALNSDNEMDQEATTLPKPFQSQELTKSNHPKLDTQKNSIAVTQTNASDLIEDPNGVIKNVTRNLSQRFLFFITVRNGEELLITESKRLFDSTEKPLTKLLNELLSGPDIAERSHGMTTAIPPGVVLNEVYIRGNIAYIDVSENFRFNRLGREGIRAQVEQVVLSATQFPNVELVQILIDGQRLNFLDPEGTYIGKPIRRSDFQ